MMSIKRWVHRRQQVASSGVIFAFVMGVVAVAMASGSIDPTGGALAATGQVRENDTVETLSAVIHQVFIEGDEAGTKATAATAVVMSVPTSAALSIRRTVMEINRPFFLLIRDDLTGVILFMGRVMAP